MNRTKVFKAGTDIAAGADFDIGESPGEIDLGERDTPLTAERSYLGEDFLHQMLPFFLEILEGA